MDSPIPSPFCSDRPRVRSVPLNRRNSINHRGNKEPESGDRDPPLRSSGVAPDTFARGGFESRPVVPLRACLPAATTVRHFASKEASRAPFEGRKGDERTRREDLRPSGSHVDRNGASNETKNHPKGRLEAPVVRSDDSCRNEQEGESKHRTRWLMRMS